MIVFMSHTQEICCAHKVFRNSLACCVGKKEVMLRNQSLHLFNFAFTWLVTCSQQSHTHMYQRLTTLSAKEKFGHGWILHGHLLPAANSSYETSVLPFSLCLRDFIPWKTRKKIPPDKEKNIWGVWFQLFKCSQFSTTFAGKDKK